MNTSLPVLAADLGGTNLRVAIFAGDRLGPARAMTHGASGTHPLAIESVAAALRTAMAGEAVVAVGVSVAGTIDADRGVVCVADNLGWTDVPLGPAIARELGVPARIDTDTYCGARAEALLGGAGSGTILSIAIGTGIGHAWIVNGEVWRGAQDAATMFGHLVIDPSGPRCYCGARGCLCQYAAGPAIQAAMTCRDEVTLTRATDALALAIAHALTLVNPDEVVLGGGAISDAWPNMDDLTARVTALVHPQVRPIQVRRSSLGDWANLLGAGLLAATTDEEIDVVGTKDVEVR